MLLQDLLTDDSNRVVSQTWGCLSRKPWIERVEPLRTQKACTLFPFFQLFKMAAGVAWTLELAASAFPSAIPAGQLPS